MTKSAREETIGRAIAKINEEGISIRLAAESYSVSRATLGRRLKATESGSSQPWARTHRFSREDEESIIEHALDMDDRGFPLTMKAITDLAAEMIDPDDKPLGKRWGSHLVKRCPKLKTRFSHSYDVQRAKCDKAWVIRKLINNLNDRITRYDIQEGNIYNMDETGFAMGQINSTLVVMRAERKGKARHLQQGNREWATAIVCIGAGGRDVPPVLLLEGRVHMQAWYECGMPKSWKIKPTEKGYINSETALQWLEHFDEHTKEQAGDRYRLLIMDRHSTHCTRMFTKYCEDHKIILAWLPSHSSHSTQPLDVGYFSILKREYGAEIRRLMRNHIMRVTKVDFIPAFVSAYKKTMREDIIKSSFRGAGITPLNAGIVLERLGLRGETPPPEVGDSSDTWQSRSPASREESILQGKFVEDRILNHCHSSPTKTLSAFQKFRSSTLKLYRRLEILQKRYDELRQVNEARVFPSRRRINAPSNVPISQGEASTLIEEASEVGRERTAPQRSRRRCRICREYFHDARNCPNNNAANIQQAMTDTHEVMTDVQQLLTDADAELQEFQMSAVVPPSDIYTDSDEQESGPSQTRVEPPRVEYPSSPPLTSM